MSVHDDGWRTSTWSGTNGNGECVEVRLTPLVVQVRNSKDRAGPVVEFTHPEWRAFLAGAREGEFDLDTVPSD